MLNVIMCKVDEVLEANNYFVASQVYCTNGTPHYVLVVECHVADLRLDLDMADIPPAVYKLEYLTSKKTKLVVQPQY